MDKTCAFADTTDGRSPPRALAESEPCEVPPELLQDRNILRFFVNLLYLDSKSDWEGLLSSGFAIKTASILVIKNRPVFIIFEQMKKQQLPGLRRERPGHGHNQIEEQSPELLLEQIVWKDASVFLFAPLSPPFPHHHPHPPLSRQTALGVTAGITCRASGALPFANGLISCGGHPISPEIDSLFHL